MQCVMREGYDEAAQDVDIELPKILEEYKKGLLSRQEAYQRLDDLMISVRVQRETEGIPDSNLDPNDYENFGLEMVERINYETLY